MTKPNAAKSGTLKIGSDIAVNRLGFGAMRITGEGVWGEPADRHECLRTLEHLPKFGVDFFDTADSQGPDVSEHLIHKALHPYKDMLVATSPAPAPSAWRHRCRSASASAKARAPAS